MDEQVAEMQRETRSSIELKRNARGEYAWDVKLYMEAGHEGDAIELIQHIDADLRDWFIPVLAKDMKPIPNALPLSDAGVDLYETHSAKKHQMGV